MENTTFNSFAPVGYNNMVSLYGETPAILIITYMFLITFFIIFGNVLIITAYRNNQALRTVSNFLILQLALADISAGISGVFGILYNILPTEYTSNFATCFAAQILLGIPCYVSLLTLLFITIDRFIAILHPLHYPTIITIERVKIVVVTIWTGISLLDIASCVHWYFDLKMRSKEQCTYGAKVEYESKILGFSYAPMFITVFISVLIMYIKILHVARNQYIQQENINNDHPNGSSLKRNLKVVKTACIVIGLFFICWFPFIAIVSTDLWGKALGLLTFQDLFSDDTAFLTMYNISFVVLLSNSVMNPIIYAVRLKEFRKAFKKILCRNNNVTQDSEGRGTTNSQQLWSLQRSQ